jgi:hypothetical protein
MSNVFTPDDGKKSDGIYILKDKSIAQLNAVIVAQYSPVTAYDELGSEQLTPVEFGINKAKFSGRYGYEFVDIQIVNEPYAVVLYCSCCQPKTKLCSHQSSALLQVIANENYLIFFDNALRNNKLKKFAADYGLADEPDLDTYFVPELQGNRLIISVKNKSLLLVTNTSLGLMEQQLMFPSSHDFVPKAAINEEQRRILVFKQHKFYKHLIVELYKAALAKDGRIKNPLSPLAPLQLVLDTNDPLELKFYTAISRFQQNIDAKINQANLEALRSIVKNPLNLECYLHDNEVSEKISANALQAITVRNITKGLQITVDEKGDFYEISGELHIGEESYPLNKLENRIRLFYKAGQNTLPRKGFANDGRGRVVQISGRNFNDTPIAVQGIPFADT